MLILLGLQGQRSQRVFFGARYKQSCVSDVAVTIAVAVAVAAASALPQVGRYFCLENNVNAPKCWLCSVIKLCVSSCTKVFKIIA